jgi:cell division protein FtsB
MPKSITPEIAKEFYDIVKPVLQTKNHEYLDGFAITQNGQEIKGIKFGPEPLAKVSSDEFSSMKNRLESILPRKMLYDITRHYWGRKSLGQVAAKAQLCDLFYYLVGREGQNPIQLGNQLGDPNIRYSKKLDISGDVLSQREKNNLQPKKEEYPKTVSIPQKEGLPTDMTALLEQLQLMRKEVHSIRTDVIQLRQSNAQLKQNLTSLRQENSLLRKQNNRLASTGMKR